MFTSNMRQAAYRSFPLNDPEFRTCLFKNMCVVNGSLTHYISSHVKETLAEDYLPSGFAGKMFHVGEIRAFTLPISTVVGEIPSHLSFHDSQVAFLDANSWSFDVGHYLVDNAIPAYAVARVFNVPFAKTVHLLETRCERFGELDEGFSRRVVDFNHSMGTYQEACLHNIEETGSMIFDHKPLYISELQRVKQDFCFHNMFVGQGSTFGTKSLDLARSIYTREFRDHLLQKMVSKGELVLAPTTTPARVILVVSKFPIPDPAPAGENKDDQTEDDVSDLSIEDLERGLCTRVKQSVAGLAAGSVSQGYEVRCVTVGELYHTSLVSLARHMQQAAVVVTVGGTSALGALLSRDGVQQVVVTHPNRLGDSQLLLFTTQFHTLYATWDKMKAFPAILNHAVELYQLRHAPDDW